MVHEAVTATSARVYVADDRDALHRVHTTLVDTALWAHGLVRPLASDERSRHYAKSRRFAGFFALGLDAAPSDVAEFSTYVDAMVTSGALAVGS